MKEYRLSILNTTSRGDLMIKYISYALNIVLVSLIVFINLNNQQTKANTIIVEIKGAVKKEGVYEIGELARVNDLIEISGGLTDDADISTINLSKELKNEDVVIVYTKKEIEEAKKGSTVIKYIEKECICPKINNSACIDDIISNSQSIINNTGKVNLNTATLEELLTIPGIGESKAKLIIEYRAKKPFSSIDDIMNIKGISDGVFEKIKAYITI